jgi:hypothetical protein
MTAEKFENGLSIIQLEDRYEMVAAADRSRKTTIEPTLTIRTAQ